MLFLNHVLQLVENGLNVSPIHASLFAVSLEPIDEMLGSRFGISVKLHEPDSVN